MAHTPEIRDAMQNGMVLMSGPVFSIMSPVTVHIRKGGLRERSNLRIDSDPKQQPSAAVRAPVMRVVGRHDHRFLCAVRAVRCCALAPMLGSLARRRFLERSALY